MPKAKNVNTLAGRKLDVEHLLKRNYALSVPQLSKRMKVSPQSIRRYLQELAKDRKVYKHYALPTRGAKKPIYYYSLSRIK
jgi:DeoR/GlpR family transcriptional regulator of sugar metabolism